MINILPQIPDELANIVGKIMIRCAGLERLIMTTLARETGKTGEELIKEIGNYKGMVLEKLITSLKANSDYGNYTKLLDEIRKSRNEIHDAFVQDFEGRYFILANNKNRSHRKIDLEGLVSLNNKIEKLVVDLNKFSLSRKK